MNEETKTSEVIGEGTYGCIHKPSLKCKNKNIKYNKKISKILLKKNAEKEMNEYNLLKNIDKKHNYYLGNPIVCEPAENEYNFKSIEKCEKFNESINDINDNNLIIMNDGGINLETFADKMHDRTNSEETTQKMELFWIEFHRILMGIQLFFKNGILHCDMKPQNIVLNESKNRVNIIDFGLMRKMDKAINDSMNSNNYLGVYHWSYPFECNFYNKHVFDEFAKMSNTDKKKYHSKIMDNLRDKKSKTVSAFRNFFSFVINQYDSAETQSIMINKYMDGFLNCITTELQEYTTFLKKSLETVDVYGVGISIAYMINMTKHLVDKNFANDLEQLSFQMTNSDLSSRYTIDQSIQRFEEILNLHNITQKHKVHFENNKLVKIKAKNMKKKILNPSTIILSKHERSSDEVVQHKPVCEYGNKFDNITKKCYKKCPEGKIRNKITRRCVKK